MQLIVTVDCGITANDEAALCRALGMELVITDHHECKSELPEAVAVVDPHRLDQPQPASELAGVGVAFKLACAIGRRHGVAAAGILRFPLPRHGGGRHAPDGREPHHGRRGPEKSESRSASASRP